MQCIVAEIGFVCVATEATNDALIDLNGVPADQQANISVTQTPGGTIVTNTGSTSGLLTFVEGNTQFTGGQLNNCTFRFAPSPGGAPTLGFNGTVLNGGTITGDAGTQSLNVGGIDPLAKRRTTKTVVTDTTSNLGGGSDSVSFFKRSDTRNSSFTTGGGADSVTFAKGSKSRNVTVDLGQGDNAADRVQIVNKSSAKKLNITNFGQEDSLVVGKRTYTYDQLQARDGRVSNNIQVDFS